MKCPLAIFTPDVGLPHATFIRRHALDLLPGKTAVMASPVVPGWMEADWSVAGPLLDLRRVTGGRIKWMLLHRMMKSVGVKSDRLMVSRFLRSHGVRVVMGEFLDFSLQWLDVVSDLGLPFFAHAHGFDISSRLLEPEWRAGYLKYRESAGIITMSRASRNELVAMGLPAGKVHVVPYGVDVPANPISRPEREEVRCVAVGLAVPRKAPILLLDAFRRATEACPRLRLDHIGGGPLLPAAREFIDAFGLENRVTLHGPQSNRFVLEWMSKADIFLQHSRTDPQTGDREGLPVSILEAMAQSLPVVSTMEAGIPEQVEEGLTGYLVNPGDSAAMAKRIVRLANDAALRHQMGLAGWARAKEHFSWAEERSGLLRVLGLDVEA